MSAPPTSVTGAQAPKVPHVEPVSAASERSTTRLVASRPEPASEPRPIVSGTAVVENHGPPETATDWPVGASVSGASVNAASAVRPVRLWTVTVRSPAAVVVPSHV